VVVASQSSTMPLLALESRPGWGLLRRDQEICRPCRPARAPASQALTPRSRHLRLAHLPDELPAQALPHSVGGPAAPVRRGLHPGHGLPPQAPQVSDSSLTCVPESSSSPLGPRTLAPPLAPTRPSLQEAEARQIRFGADDGGLRDFRRATSAEIPIRTAKFRNSMPTSST